MFMFTFEMRFATIGLVLAVASLILLTVVLSMSSATLDRTATLRTRLDDVHAAHRIVAALRGERRATLRFLIGRQWFDDAFRAARAVAANNGSSTDSDTTALRQEAVGLGKALYAAQAALLEAREHTNAVLDGTPRALLGRLDSARTNLTRAADLAALLDGTVERRYARRGTGQLATDDEAAVAASAQRDYNRALAALSPAHARASLQQHFTAAEATTSEVSSAGFWRTVAATMGDAALTALAAPTDGTSFAPSLLQSMRARVDVLMAPLWLAHMQSLGGLADPFVAVRVTLDAEAPAAVGAQLSALWTSATSLAASSVPATNVNFTDDTAAWVFAQAGFGNGTQGYGVLERAAGLYIRTERNLLLLASRLLELGTPELPDLFDAFSLSVLAVAVNNARSVFTAPSTALEGEAALTGAVGARNLTTSPSPRLGRLAVAAQAWGVVAPRALLPPPLARFLAAVAPRDPLHVSAAAALSSFNGALTERLTAALGGGTNGSAALSSAVQECLSATAAASLGGHALGTVAAFNALGALLDLQPAPTGFRSGGIESCACVLALSRQRQEVMRHAVAVMVAVVCAVVALGALVSRFVKRSAAMQQEGAFGVERQVLLRMDELVHCIQSFHLAPPPPPRALLGTAVGAIEIRMQYLIATLLAVAPSLPALLLPERSMAAALRLREVARSLDVPAASRDSIRDRGLKLHCIARSGATGTADTDGTDGGGTTSPATATVTGAAIDGILGAAGVDPALAFDDSSDESGADVDEQRRSGAVIAAQWSEREWVSRFVAAGLDAPDDDAPASSEGEGVGADDVTDDATARASRLLLQRVSMPPQMRGLCVPRASRYLHHATQAAPALAFGAFLCLDLTPLMAMHSPEGLDTAAEAFPALLNLFTEVTVACGGIVLSTALDRAIGCWNLAAPATPRPCYTAMRAACHLAQQIAHLKRNGGLRLFTAFEAAQLRLGIGVTAGWVHVGAYGSEGAARTFQALGPAVLRAQQVAAANLQHGTLVTCDEVVRAAVEVNYACKPLEELAGSYPERHPATAPLMAAPYRTQIVAPTTSLGGAGFDQPLTSDTDARGGVAMAPAFARIVRVYEVIPPFAPKDALFDEQLQFYKQAFALFSAHYYGDATREFRRYTQRFGYDRSVERLQDLLAMATASVEAH